MAREPMLLYIWNEWTIQILVLSSFALQTFLFVFARTRWRGCFSVMRILLWLAYLMADSTAVYTLGHLSISGLPREQKLAVFWAPFLLVHLGSQDTITAYALEDNQLWPRHLLTLGIQALGVAYVFYKHFAEIPTSLGWAAILMFIVGVTKYAERIWALKCATVDSIRNSINDHRTVSAYYDKLPPRGARAEEYDEEELMLFAQAMLPLCKGGIVNFPVALTTHPDFPPSKLNWNWKATFKVVEMELSLMYDILYTKAAVIHTWYGYCIHVFSPVATVGAFVLFQISGFRNGYSRTDIAITYILLVGAFLLDTASVFSALGSTWACNFLLNKDWIGFGLVILSLRRHFKAFASNRGWSGSIGQYNLLHFCSSPTTKLGEVAKMMGLENWWDKWHYSGTLVISEDVKEFVFKCVWQLMKKIQDPRAEDDDNQSTRCNKEVEEPIATMPIWNGSAWFGPEPYQETARKRMKLAESLDFGVELQEVILTWHIFTEIFFCGSDTQDVASLKYLKEIKALSNYMVFLVVVRPDTLPGLVQHSLYESTVCDLVCIRHLLVKPISYTEDAKMFDKALKEPVRPFRMTSITVSHGALYARLMVELVDVDNPNKPSTVISSYEDDDHVAMDKLKRMMPDLKSSCRGDVFDMPKAMALILDTWVRLLVFASVRCSRDTHARDISRGSQLTTVVWLMQEHASVLLNRPIGFERFSEA